MRAPMFANPKFVVHPDAPAHRSPLEQNPPQTRTQPEVRRDGRGGPASGSASGPRRTGAEREMEIQGILTPTHFEDPFSAPPRPASRAPRASHFPFRPPSAPWAADTHTHTHIRGAGWAMATARRRPPQRARAVFGGHAAGPYRDRIPRSLGAPARARACAPLAALVGSAAAARAGGAACGRSATDVRRLAHAERYPLFKAKNHTGYRPPCQRLIDAHL